MNLNLLVQKGQNLIALKQECQTGGAISCPMSPEVILY